MRALRCSPPGGVGESLDSIGKPGFPIGIPGRLGRADRHVCLVVAGRAIQSFPPLSRAMTFASRPMLRAAFPGKRMTWPVAASATRESNKRISELLVCLRNKCAPPSHVKCGSVQCCRTKRGMAKGHPLQQSGRLLYGWIPLPGAARLDATEPIACIVNVGRSGIGISGRLVPILREWRPFGPDF